MIYLLTIILLITCILAFIEERLPEYKWYLYILLGGILITMAALKPIGIDNDSDTYEIYFLHWDDPVFSVLVEPSFLFISQLLNHITHNVHWIFLFYASIGLTLKLQAIKKLTPLVFLAMAVYVSNYFILHEFTQLRASIASGILLLSVKPIAEGRRKRATLYMLVAMVFHYSSAALFPLLLLNNKEMNLQQRIVWALVIPFGYVLWITGISIGDIPIPYISDKLNTYKELQEEGLFDAVNIFNLVYLVKILIYYFILYFYDTISGNNKYLPLLLKMEGLSLFCFSGLSAIPILAFRVSELYGIVEVVLFTCVFYTVNPKWLGKLTVITIALALFAINVFYNDILHFS